MQDQPITIENPITDDELWRDIIDLAAKGCSNSYIINKLGITKYRLKKIYQNNKYHKIRSRKISPDMCINIHTLYLVGVRPKTICRDFNISYPTYKKIIENAAFENSEGTDVIRIVKAFNSFPNKFQHCHANLQ